jgi:serine/threonine-protein kinase RsbW
MHVVATDRNASMARRRLRDWLTLDVASDLLDDLVLAVYEAMTNAVEHGYADQPHRPGSVRLQARRGSGQVQITVADEGSWRASTGQRFRGRGLALMRLLTHDVHIVSGHGGTVVRLWAEVIS